MPGGPTVKAKFKDGPLSGQTKDVQIVEGRPPKTIDIDGPGDKTNRYCLADWAQSGPTAAYEFLYEV